MMGRLLVSIVILSVALDCSNEKTSNEDEFLRDFIASNELKGKKIVYANQLENATMNALNNAIISETRMLGESNTIYLTQHEKDNIISSLQTQKIGYPKSLHIYQMISADSLTMIFKGNNLPKNWSVFHERYKADLFYFSKPIFFRNNTLCAFYWGHPCGELCGEGEFSIYKKTWRGWKKHVRLYAWSS